MSFEPLADYMASKALFGFVVPCRPMAHQRTRHTRTGRAYNTKEQVAYQGLVAAVAKGAGKDIFFEGPVRLTLNFYFKRPDADKKKLMRYARTKMDLDNLIKQVCDALNEVLWVDDSQVVEVTAKKLYTDAQEHTWIQIQDLSEK